MPAIGRTTQDALARVVAVTLRPFSVAFGLFIGYQVYRGLLNETVSGRAWIIAADAVVALYLLGLAASLQWRPPPLRWMNPLGASIAIALAGTDLVTTAVRGVVPGFPAAAFVFAGIGAVVLSWRWMIATSAVLWIMWLSTTLAFTDNWGESLFTMQIAGITGLAIHWGRLNAYQKLIEARDNEAHARAELEQINEELDRFAGVAAHDLKSPISAIRLKAELLKRQNKDPATEQTLVELEHVAQNIGRMVDDLLAYARSGRDNTEEHLASLSSVALEIHEQFADQFASVGGRLIIQPLPDYQADETMLQQLLQNLVSNALAYRSERDLIVEIMGAKVSDQIVLKISDNGRGFDPALASAIFQPFKRGDNEAPGHGLGLATCRRIAEKLGGKIRGETIPGQGATFIIEVPEKREKEVQSD